MPPQKIITKPALANNNNNFFGYEVQVYTNRVIAGRLLAFTPTAVLFQTLHSLLSHLKCLCFQCYERLMIIIYNHKNRYLLQIGCNGMFLQLILSYSNNYIQMITHHFVITMIYYCFKLLNCTLMRIIIFEKKIYIFIFIYLRYIYIIFFLQGI